VARRGGGARRAVVIAVSVGVNEQAEEDQLEDIARYFRFLRRCR